MLAARRRMIDRVLPADGGEAAIIPRGQDARGFAAEAAAPGAAREWTWSQPGRINYAIDDADRKYAAGEVLGQYQRIAEGIDGGSVLGVVSYPAGNRATRRHEVLHGLTDAARMGVDGMPYWSRVAAANPLGLGAYLDELSATAAEGTAGLVKKTFAWPGYSLDYITHGEPASAAAAAASWLVPMAAVGTAVGTAAGGAIGAGADALGYSRQPDDSENRTEELLAKIRARRLAKMAADSSQPLLIRRAGQ